jgi:hypothetical protein
MQKQIGCFYEHLQDKAVALARALYQWNDNDNEAT